MGLALYEGVYPVSTVKHQIKRACKMIIQISSQFPSLTKYLDLLRREPVNHSLC